MRWRQDADTRAGCRAAELRLVLYKQNPTFVGGIINSGPRLRSACDPALASARASEHRSSRTNHFGAGEPTIGPCGGFGAAVFLLSSDRRRVVFVSTRSVNRLGFILAEAQQ